MPQRLLRAQLNVETFITYARYTLNCYSTNKGIKLEPTHYLLAIFFVALLILVIQKVIPKPITKDTRVNGKMTIGGIMKEFRQLTSTHFEYKKIDESQV